jgi:hypothetical protein
MATSASTTSCSRRCCIASSHRQVAPAGRTGKLDPIDPKTHKVESIGGFSAETDKFAGGHGEGTTSADAGGGYIFASDRGRSDVNVVDPKSSKIVGTVKLAGGPDYVRWVEPAREVWVTEPGKKQIEFFALDGGKLVRKGVIDVPGGPESLVIDATRGRAYMHTSYASSTGGKPHAANSSGSTNVVSSTTRPSASSDMTVRQTAR